MTTAGIEPHIAERLRADGRRIVITGAGGWLGMATLDLLDDALSDRPTEILCFGSSERDLTLRGGRTYRQRPLRELRGIGAAPTLVLHYAFLTKDRADAMDDAAYANACRELDGEVLASLQAIAADAVFVASSGAVTKVDEANASRGMRLYGALKLEQENRFEAWANTAGKRAVIGRLFNLSGPYMNKLSSYALSCFILDCLAGRPVAVNAPHPVHRGYVAIREVLSLILALMLERAAGTTTFETGGAGAEMATIARDVSAALGAGEVVRAPLQSDVADIYCGDDGAYRRLLADHRIESVPFAQQVRETADFLSFSGHA